jgi:hypothetical protein
MPITHYLLKSEGLKLKIKSNILGKNHKNRELASDIINGIGYR